MFRIEKLILMNFEKNSYTYNFAEGINYFVGSNNTGKTEFYKFIDFMFGSDMNINNYDWYKGSLQKCTIKMSVEGKCYWITRTEHPEENMSYRVFTMFNFLGEKGQGLTRDFLDKCRDIKYSVKLSPVLNYIFNDNIERIAEIKEKIEKLKEKIRLLEVKNDSFKFAQKQINSNLLKINSNVFFNGHNGDDIQKELTKIMNMNVDQPKRMRRSVSELEVIYSNLSEQIKIYDNTIMNYQQNEKENKNRSLLLNNLQILIENEPSMQYLAQPLVNLINELNGSITFGKYIISDETIKELKRQRNQVISEIKKQNSKYKCYSLEEKAKAIALIQAYLHEDNKDVDGELNECKAELRKLKKELQELQNSDNSKKIDRFSEIITNLYESGKTDSEIIKTDFSRENFSIKYLKRGNILQPIDRSNDRNNDNLYLGSMARHTLIQLSGYLAFMDILVTERKYPIIPFLIIDHLSKPFSDDNKKAVGKIFMKFYDIISKSDVQVFMFDDIAPELLGIMPDHCEKLRTEEKTGFNPFYQGNK